MARDRQSRSGSDPALAPKTASGDGSGAAGDRDDGASELTEEYWLDLWAFGTSPYGLGLTEDKLWGLCPVEYLALKEQWKRSQEQSIHLLAVLRADIYNTAGKTYDRTFEPKDFLPEAKDQSLEARAKELIAKGYSPSEALAMASMKNTKEHNLYVLDAAQRAAARQKQSRRVK